MVGAHLVRIDHERSAKMGDGPSFGLLAAFAEHPNTGGVRGGKGLLAVERIEALRKNFPADRRVAARLQAEMVKRGMITRTRPAAGEHPAPGDAVFFAPPFVITEAEVERLVDVCRDAAEVVLGT
jgi:L-2,4-diaminobutyrate transaminase